MGDQQKCMESKMECPPTEDLPSGTAGGEVTAARDESWSEDNVSLFPSSDHTTHRLQRCLFGGNRQH